MEKICFILSDYRLVVLSALVLVTNAVNIQKNVKNIVENPLPQWIEPTIFAISVNLQQIWNFESSGGVSTKNMFGRNEQDMLVNPPQQIDPSYDVVDVPNAPAKKNCTGSTNCIPKCFAEKGSRGIPGMPGATGPQGPHGYDGGEGPQGEKGSKGGTGLQGQRGHKGKTYRKNVVKM